MEKEKKTSLLSLDQARLDKMFQRMREGRHLHIAKGTAKRSPEVQRQIDEVKAQMRQK